MTPTPGASLRTGSEASSWRATNLTSAMRDECVDARPRKQGPRHEAPAAQEFITKAIKELQEARAMRGECWVAPPSVVEAPDTGTEVHVCVSIPGLNRAAS